MLDIGQFYLVDSWDHDVIAIVHPTLGLHGFERKRFAFCASTEEGVIDLTWFREENRVRYRSLDSVNDTRCIDQS